MKVMQLSYSIKHSIFELPELIYILYGLICCCPKFHYFYYFWKIRERKACFSLPFLFPSPFYVLYAQWIKEVNSDYPYQLIIVYNFYCYYCCVNIRFHQFLLLFFLFFFVSFHYLPNPLLPFKELLF